jgi:hypothetical protein
MDGFVFSLGLLAFFNVIATSFVLDDIIQTLRDEHQDAWIAEGRPHEHFLGFGRDFRLFGGLIRTLLGFRILFKMPVWAKRDSKLWTLVVFYRTLHVSIIVLIAAVVLLSVLL